MFRRIAARAAMLFVKLRVEIRGQHVWRGRGIFAQVIYLLEGAPDPLRELRRLVIDMKTYQAHFQRRTLARGALRSRLNLAASGQGHKRLKVIEASPEFRRDFA